MKTTHWLAVAAAVAVGGVIVYSRLAAGDPPLPKVPLTTEVARTDAPQLELPPVVLPPDEPLVMPPVPVTEAVAVPLPTQKLDAGATSPVTLTSATDPVIPPVPAVPPVPPVSVPSAPTVPAGPALPVPSMPVAPPEPPIPSPVTPVETPVAPSVPPVAPTTPTYPLPVPTMPIAPASPPLDVAPTVPAPPEPKAPALSVPPPAPAPQLLPPPAPTPVQPSVPVPAKPEIKSAPMETRPPEALAVTGRFVVLQENKLIEGAVSVSSDTVFVNQGAVTRKFPKSQVQFVADSRDEVYRFMAAKVPATSAAARLQVARWCMFNGMREQALAEAREAQKIRPAAGEDPRVHNAAADLVRSLELSLQQYPVETAAKMAAPAAPTFPAELAPVRPAPPAVLDPEPDVSPEAALVFGARVQPFLANRCTECHAKPDYPGKFKLVRVNPTEAGPQATRTNLRAVAGQLRKDAPDASPLLTKALATHGGMKLPAIESRQAVVYQTLEAWTALAVGTPLATPSAPPQIPAPPTPQAGDGSLPLPPVTPAYPAPAAPLPASPTPVPLPVTSDPLPVLPAPTFPTPVPPVAPPVPVIPPATDPVPPALPPTKPPVPKSVPPIPPADAGVVPLPPIPPPATTARRPSVPQAPVGATEFGASIPPKVPATGPTGGDEFDPAGFNQQPKK